MKLRWSDLLAWEGSLGRAPYLAVAGAGLVFVYLINQFVGSTISQMIPAVDVFTYGFDVEAIFTLSFSSEDRSRIVLAIILSLPFLWIGFLVTLKRLRSAGLYTWLALLFFYPLLHIPLFIALAVIPPQPKPQAPLEGVQNIPETFFSKLIPQDSLRMALLAVVMPILVSLAFIIWGKGEYPGYILGLTVTFGVPASQGILASALYCYRNRSGWGGCIAISLYTQLVAISLLFVHLLDVYTYSMLLSPHWGIPRSVAMLVASGISTNFPFGWLFSTVAAFHGYIAIWAFLLTFPLAMFGGFVGCGFHRVGVLKFRKSQRV